MLLGLAAGKIGDLVFYRDGGEQRTRTRVIPKNPRSFAQMAQRVCIANVSATYRLLKAVLAGSFTGRPSNQSGYNAFASSAINISPYLTRGLALADNVIPAPYVVARGTIAPVTYTMKVESFEGILSLAIAGLTTEDATIAAVSSKLLAAYPQLQQGDVITFAAIGFVTTQDGEFGFGSRGTSIVVSMKIDTSDSTALPSARLQPAAGALNLVVSEESPAASGAVIVSRVDGSGALQTSFAVLALTEVAESLYTSYRSEETLNDAVQSYNVGESSILRE